MRGRVAITAFASNVARVQSACEAARANNRSVCLLGRSMIRVVGAAQTALVRRRQAIHRVLADAGDEAALRSDLESALEAALNEGLVADAVIAENRGQAQALWHMRESIPEGARQEPVMVYRHDIAVAVGRIPAFIREAQAALEARFPGVRLICFGHLGDGNLHYNLSEADGGDGGALASRTAEIRRAVHDLVAAHGGSFSAEHGIGQSKVGELERYEDPVALDVMRAVKRALDPDGLMNPGKVLRDQPAAAPGRRSLRNT